MWNGLSGVAGAALIAAIVGGAGLITVAMIVLLRPILIRYALARPNARSSHCVPTPQGGGIAVIGVTILVTLAALASAPALAGESSSPLLALLAAATALAVLGAVDDIRPLPAAPRLAVQAAAVGLVVATLPGEARIFPEIVPFAIERGFALLAGLWFVNLVNFMDGLDWMSVAEMAPITAALLVAALLGWLPASAGIVAAALFGAILGFAPFNRPVARLFLGDVGSLPLGLVVFWLLWHLASDGGWAAALLLPLYYLVDATLTLLRRLWRGERVWEAHRSHYYQQATARGFRVPAIIATVFTLNVALVALAFLSRFTLAGALAALTVGSVLVGLVLSRFAHGPTEPS